jgi:peptide deformylase
VEYHDTAGQKHSEQFEGYFSELLQHEVDHLNGILFIDHIEKLETLMMMEGGTDCTAAVNKHEV